MSWNNVIPWEVLECESKCKKVYAGAYYQDEVEHVADCPIGKEIKEEHERTKNRQRNAERSESVGGSEGST